MGDTPATTPSVVVGIDGSRSALDAALWAVDEAVSLDIPLRLIFAVDPDAEPGGEQAVRELACAETAIHHAFNAIESTGRPVKMEAEILRARPVRALVDASRWAAMLCVGDLGLQRNTHGRFGSTAAAVATSAHCPVAIVRRSDTRPTAPGWVVAEVDDSPGSSAVLQCALDEARLRGAPLRVLTTWQSRFTDISDSRAVSDGNRLARAQLDRRLAQWKKRYPDLDVQAVAVRGTTLNYLAEHARSIRLLVVSHERAHGIRDLVGPPGYAPLHEAGCSVVVCQPQNVL